MLAYKGFGPGQNCRGYSFLLGLNVTDKANCRENGFHCAENPLDCLSYYPDMEKSEYFIVNAGGDLDEDGTDTKIACTELTLIRKLTKKEFFLHALAFMVDHPYRKWSRHVKKDYFRAVHGYAVVRGADPAACGKKGDILVLIKESPENGKIEQSALLEVDGEKILPDVWYGTDLLARRCPDGAKNPLVR